MYSLSSLAADACYEASHKGGTIDVTSVAKFPPLGQVGKLGNVGGRLEGGKIKMEGEDKAGGKKEEEEVKE
ncbi:hypothetical protein E2C01_047296 [Portunus trituberculatus]|uniref:Uncharacterized protein n=1 Tax=Portunus trituberculatus TaxID=210409 RepID=A0A5B7G7C7_PORTR|nr:hypothetical protein [Portunus trituberculatus]